MHEHNILYLVFVKYKGTDQGSTGTGVAISRDGLIMTNAHVIKGPGGEVEQIYVFSSYGSKQGKSEPVKAELKYSVFNEEPSTQGEMMDLALLQVDISKFKSWDYLLLEPENIEKGTTVVAYGYPGVALKDFDLSKMALEVVHSKPGVISVITGNVYTHDCSTFFGNSGGPLVTEDGKLVGINTAIHLQQERDGHVITSDYSLSIRSGVAKEFLDECLKRMNRK